MARSAALNPASTPFFPGGIRASDDEGSGLGFGHHAFQEQDRNSMSSLSISPSEYRSVRSSPSPPQDDRDSEHDLRHQPSPGPDGGSRPSPTFRQPDANRPYPAIETRVAREASILGTLDVLPEGEDNQDTPVPAPTDNGTHTPSSSFFSTQQRGRERLSTPPVAVYHGGSSFNATGAFTSSSPVSSLDSGSQFAPSNDQTQSFEAQLKASPMIHDILDRLVRCEYSTREIQRDLGDVHRKVTLLVERSLGVSVQPEFKDPFAPNVNGQSFSSPSLNGPRPSIGNIAPNQPTPSDDITTISQRLNTLTTSVGQLLALQTQHIQSTTSGLPNNSIMGSNTPQGDLAPNQMMSPPVISNTSMLGHGLPNRPDLRPSPRAPNPPMRTWSAGALDLPMRPSDSSIGRQDAVLRDKRRSVSGLLRRDSSGVRPATDYSYVA
jgi:hypothetical protein